MDSYQLYSKPMDHHTTPIIYAASATAVGGGLWAWFGANAAAIGAICAIGGFVIGLITLGVNVYFKWKAHKINVEKLQR